MLRGLVALSLVLTVGPLSAGAASASIPFVPERIVDLSLMPQQRALTTSGPYQYVFRHSGLCLANPAGSLANGTQMIQWACSNLDDQLWYLDWGADGESFRLRNKRSGKCLDVRAGSVANGTVIQQWTCSAANVNEHFYILAGGVPYPFYYLASKLSTASYHVCVHQQGAVSANNGRVTLWHCINQANVHLSNY